MNVRTRGLSRRTATAGGDLRRLYTCACTAAVSVVLFNKYVVQMINVRSERHKKLIYQRLQHVPRIFRHQSTEKVAYGVKRGGRVGNCVS